jgi:hypothetical protein
VYRKEEFGWVMENRESVSEGRHWMSSGEREQCIGRIVVV